MGRSVNNKGRNKYAAKHVRFYEHELSSEAYRSLDVYARALLIEFKRRHNGSNNGRIHMSYREASSACKCSQKPIRRAFIELQEKGFIQVAKKGAFSVKIRHATEWILTEYPVGDQLPSKEFMRWSNSETSPIKKKIRRTHGTGSVYPEHKIASYSNEKQSADIPRGYREGKNELSHGVPRECTYSLPFTHNEAQASGASKAQAQSCADIELIEKNRNKAACDVLVKLGGFCKVKNMSKIAFESITSEHQKLNLTNGRIRSLAFQAQMRAAARNNF